MHDLQESLFIVAETRLCIAHLQEVTRANGAHAAQGRQAIRESTIAIYDAERLLRSQWPGPPAL